VLLLVLFLTLPGHPLNLDSLDFWESPEPTLPVAPPVTDENLTGCRDFDPLVANITFKLTVCSGVNGFGWFSGTVVLQRPTTEAEESDEELAHRGEGRKLSPDPEVEERLRNTVGPDSFFVMLAGPEIVDLGLPVFTRAIPLGDKSPFATVGVPKSGEKGLHQENGEGPGTRLRYEYPFNVTLNGQYRLMVHLTGVNYTNTDEVTTLGRQYLFTALFQAFFSVSQARPWDEAVTHELSLPLCPGSSEGREEFKGRWVYGAFRTGKTWTSPCLPHCLWKPNSNLASNGTFEWATDNHPVIGLQWIPFECRLREFSVVQAENCLSQDENGPRPVFATFLGDSHVRRMHARLLATTLKHPAFSSCTNATEGSRDVRCVCVGCELGCPHLNSELPEKVLYGEIRGFPDKTCAATRFLNDTTPGMVEKDRVRYTLDHTYGKHGISKPVSNMLKEQRRKRLRVLEVLGLDPGTGRQAAGEVIVMNFGAWLAHDPQHGGQKTLGEFEQILRDTADAVEKTFPETVADGTRGPLLFWAMIPPSHPVAKDSFLWAANTRVRLMNEVADKVLLNRTESGRRWEVLRSFDVFSPLFKTSDGHFNTFHQDVVISSLLNRLCPL